MDNTELLESVVAIVSGVTAAVCYTLLFVAMSAPTVETLLSYVS